MKSIVENNDRVTISFTGMLDNGTIFIEIPKEKPMTLTVGASELPPTVESILLGMAVGETRSIKVPPDEGYGHRLKDLVHNVPRKNFSEQTLKPGMVISQKVHHKGQDHSVPATILEVADDTVVIDYNHPLAGHHLTYRLSLLSIEKAR